MAAIELRGLAKSFGAAKVINDLNLTVGSGEFVTLLGPSGCGKSTTLKSIAGLIEPDAGTILIDGIDVTDVPVNRRNIGMVFQSLALFPHMTVEENVMFGLLRRRLPAADARTRAIDALRQVQLADYASRIPAQLSGGQQQRVALARAFVTKPAMLLLDEPLGALDRKLREELQIEIRQLTRQLGITSIFVTHDQHEAIVLSDRIAVMNCGRIEQIGRPDVVFENPQTPFVAEFVGVSNLLPGRIVSNGGGNVEIAAGIRLHAATDQPVGRTVRVGLRPENAEVFARADAPHGAVQCSVVEAVYQGAQILLELSPLDAGEVRLRARLPTANRPDKQVRLKAGEHVAVRWRKESILIYPNND
jgi:ABC-type Fe3+/spermidine/putrescine transport system ATPase subunit